MRVHYKTRSATCNSTDFCDFYINKIERLGNCGSCGGNLIFGEAILRLLEDPVVNACLPSAGECNDAIRLFMGVCWRPVMSPSPDEPIALMWVSCDETECCISRYRVCQVAGDYYAQQITPPTYTGDCEEFVDPTCEPFCAKAPAGSPPPETGILGVGESPASMESVVVQPNPANGQLTITVINPRGLTKSLQVSNANGQVVDLPATVTQTGDMVHFTFDVQNMPAGTYYYRIARNQGAALTGQVSVVK